jgi:hypothetical protein
MRCRREGLANAKEQAQPEGDGDRDNAPGVAKFSAENHMVPSLEVPVCLSSLSPMEELIIARAAAMLRVFRITRGGQTGYRGHVASFPQNIEGLRTALPHSGPVMTAVVKARVRPEGNPFIFRVRREHVRRALAWLKENNEYYHAVEIDEEVLATLPDDDTHMAGIDFVIQEEGDDNMPAQDFGQDDNMPAQDFGQDFGEAAAAPSESGVLQEHRPTTTNRELGLDAVRRAVGAPQTNGPQGIPQVPDPEEARIPWPAVDRTHPINEYQTEGLWAMLFPTLYPRGRADFLHPRRLRVTVADYVRHLMLFEDGRFAAHPRWRYFATNVVLRWRGLANAKIYLRQADGEQALTAGAVRERLAEGDGGTRLAKQILYYGSTIAGTPSYWSRQQKNLFSMVTALGKPTFFLTLSAADTLWPEVRATLLEMFPQDAALSNQQLVNKYPLLADKIFQLRVEAFMGALQQTLGFVDFWYRFEYQFRGSPHIHALLWLPPAQDPFANEDVESKKAEMEAFLDRYLCESHTAPTAREPGRKPSEKTLAEVSDDNLENDLNNVIGAVQRHDKCGRSCLRTTKKGEHCRYGFPKPLVDATKVSRDEKGRIKMEIARNDDRVNSHNKQVSSVWRANHDIQVCKDTFSLFKYLGKYATKSEQSSEELAAFLLRSIAGVPDDQEAALARRVLLLLIGDRDYSAQEVCHIGIAAPLVRCSRAFVLISTDPARQMMDYRRTALEGEEIFAPNAIDRYVERVSENKNLSDQERRVLPRLSLYRFNSEYDVRTSKKRLSNKVIVSVMPKFSSDPNGDDYEEYCKQQLILHKPFRRAVGGLKGNAESWAEAYATALEDGSLRPPELLHRPAAPEDEDEANSDTEEPIVPGTLERDHDDWMIAVHPRPEEAADAHGQINVDWWADAEPYKVDGSLVHLSTWLRDQRANLAAVEAPTVAGLEPNPTQRQVLDIIDHHARCAHPGKKPLRLIVHGSAGTGKSFVINSARDGALRGKVKVSAPTGVAAFNVQGSTLHSTFKLSRTGDQVPLKGAGKDSLQTAFADTGYVIIDEMSMVGATAFGKVATRLQEAKPRNAPESLADMSVILLGDFFQLAPVADTPLYKTPDAWMGRNRLKFAGTAAFRSFETCVTLQQNMRQDDDVEFAAFLERLRHGIHTRDDWSMLQERRPDVIARSPGGMEAFADAVRLFTTRDEVQEFNNLRVIENETPKADIQAKHEGGHTAASAPPDEAGNLDARMTLCNGARVMVTRNLLTEHGIVNGARGTVAAIVYEEGKKPPALPLAVTLRLDRYTGPTLPDGTVPIVPVKEQFHGARNVPCSRTMLPLRLAYAMTIHKCQGLTLPQVVVNLGKREMSPGLTYVALSRVKRLRDLVVEAHDFPRLRDVQRKPGNDPKDRHVCIDRILRLSSQVVCACGTTLGPPPAVPPPAPAPQDVPEVVPATPPRVATPRVRVISQASPASSTASPIAKRTRRRR